LEIGLWGDAVKNREDALRIYNELVAIFPESSNRNFNEKLDLEWEYTLTFGLVEIDEQEQEDIVVSGRK